ncbi:acyltransferase family protein [Bacillus gobiensis]|uniref:acyltransferase family protein n=1 Tax=Bacillus gobiensis TaxID=1441095 RepID=UPI003D1F5C3F
MEKNREPYFDNAKFLLVFLVVFGHIIQSYISSNEFMLNIYKFVYTFHMPAFILVSGYFSKGFNRHGYIKKITYKLIFPYLIFQAIYTIYNHFIQDSKIKLNPFDPEWSLWFLISLFCWNLLLFLFTKIPPKLAFTVSLVIALTVGYVDFVNHVLSLSRTLVFFPIFLAGYYLKKEHFDKIRTMKSKLTSIAMLTVVFICCLLIQFDYTWLFGSKPYSYFGEPGVISLVERLGFYCLTFVATFSFLAIIPEKKYFFTRWGTRTLYVYLLHGFAIKFFRHSSTMEWLHNYESLLMVTLLAAVLTCLLSTTFVKKLAEPVIELK